MVVIHVNYLEIEFVSRCIVVVDESLPTAVAHTERLAQLRRRVLLSATATVVVSATIVSTLVATITSASGNELSATQRV